MSGANLLFYGTTGPSGTADGDSQPDRSQWLGRFRAAETLHDTLGTLTATQLATAGHRLTDSARIGDGAGAHVHKWLAMQTGPAALEAARVESFDNATGTFTLDRVLTVQAQSGDAYALFPAGNVFPNVSALQSLAGDTRYRCIRLHNTHGAALTDVRVHFALLSVGPFFARIHPDNMSQPFLQRDDDQTDVVNVMGFPDPLGGPDNFSALADEPRNWSTPFSRDAADSTAPAVNDNNGLAIWLRRIIHPGLLHRRSVAVQIIATTTLAGSDPDPLAATAVIAFDMLPAAATVELAADRFVAIGGGARLRGRVTFQGDSPGALRAGRFRLPIGDPASLVTPDDPLPGFGVTDRRGEAFAILQAPSDRAQAGNVTVPAFGIVEGDEIAGVGSVVLGSADISFGYDVAASGSTPEPARDYLLEPAAAFLGGTA